MTTIPLAYTVKLLNWNNNDKKYDAEFFNFDTQEGAKNYWNELRDQGKKCRFIYHRLFLRTTDEISLESLKTKYPNIINYEKKNDNSCILYFKTDSDKKEAKPVGNDKLFKFRIKNTTQKNTNPKPKKEKSESND